MTHQHMGDLVQAMLAKKHEEKQKKESDEAFEKLRKLEMQLDELNHSSVQTHEEQESNKHRYSNFLETHSPSTASDQCALTNEDVHVLVRSAFSLREELLRVQTRLATQLHHRKATINEKWKQTNTQINPDYINQLQYAARRGDNIVREKSALERLVKMLTCKMLAIKYRMRKRANQVLEQYQLLAQYLDGTDGNEYSEMHHAGDDYDPNDSPRSTRGVMTQQSEVALWMQEAHKLIIKTKLPTRSGGERQPHSYSIEPMLVCLQEGQHVFRVSAERSKAVLAAEREKASDHFQRTLELSQELRGVQERLRKFRAEGADAERDTLEQLATLRHENQDYAQRVKIAEASISRLKLEHQLTERKLNLFQKTTRVMRSKEQEDDEASLSGSPGGVGGNGNMSPRGGAYGDTPRTKAQQYKQINPHQPFPTARKHGRGGGRAQTHAPRSARDARREIARTGTVNGTSRMPLPVPFTPRSGTAPISPYRTPVTNGYLVHTNVRRRHRKPHGSPLQPITGEQGNYYYPEGGDGSGYGD